MVIKEGLVGDHACTRNGPRRGGFPREKSQISRPQSMRPGFSLHPPHRCPCDAADRSRLNFPLFFFVDLNLKSTHFLHPTCRLALLDFLAIIKRESAP